MSDELTRYFQELSNQDREALEERIERYRDQLAEMGYEVGIAEAENGLFMGALVIDREDGRFGFLEEDGSVSWLSNSRDALGGLASAIMQKPSDELREELDST